MQFDEWTIGRKIASHRARRGLTQEELAGLVGISLSLMKKIESGDRLVTRFSQLLLFAQALRIPDLRELTGVPLPLMPDGRRGHPEANAVRAAFMERSRPAVEPTTLAALAADIERTWQAWQSPSPFRYAQVGQDLPHLLRGTRLLLLTADDDERRAALAEASKLYQLVRSWTKRVGEHELSLVAADRAVAAAMEADDPDLAGAASWNLAMILSARGHTEQARAVCREAIAELRPTMPDAGPARLAVWGGLHLLAAVEAARKDDASDARRLLDAADKIADRIGETNHFRMVFGPTNVACHRVATALELGRTRDALTIAERVSVHNAPAVERRLTFHLDAARGYARTGNDIAAVHMLQRIHAESPEELRFGSGTRETLRLLVGRAKPAILADLRPMAEAAGLS
ncbi:helix-turn-helix domain-containing protein [Micromonospora sp. CA-263727]|uniref:helix-turn-helix domain-containing protein n=1 Tax=Micromonospora sp. CA-263727 TaxID=3239967 RepID=UPI003D942101